MIKIPKISIIIPVYNVEPYIRRCLDSLVNQTMPDLELICVDDCSTDNSLAIINEYALNDSRLKVISFNRNCSVAAARNKGLESSSGIYVAFLDPDDYVELNFYEELYQKAFETDADIVKTPTKIINFEGHIAVRDRNKLISKNGKYYFSYEMCSAIYKRSIIEENKIRFLEDLIVSEDLVFLLTLIMKVEKLYFVNNVYQYYCMREGSLFVHCFLPISSDKIKSALKAFNILGKMFNKNEVYKKNKDAYITRFFNNFNGILMYMVRNYSKEIKLLCAKTLVSIYEDCKYPKQMLEKVKNKKITKLVESKNIEKLVRELKKYKNVLYVKGEISLLENIFSVRNVEMEKHRYKVLIFLGKTYILKYVP